MAQTTGTAPNPIQDELRKRLGRPNAPGPFGPAPNAAGMSSTPQYPTDTKAPETPDTTSVRAPDPTLAIPPSGGITGGGSAPMANPPPASSGASGLGTFSPGMTDDQVRGLANQYISAGGAKNIDNGQYWVDAYKRFGSSDPGYFLTRLKQGIADQPGYNRAYGDIHTPSDAGAHTPGAGADTKGPELAYGDFGPGGNLATPHPVDPLARSRTTGPELTYGDTPGYSDFGPGGNLATPHPVDPLALARTAGSTGARPPIIPNPPPPTTPGSTSAIDSTKSNALYDLLMKRAGASLDINPNDPIIKAQTDAFAAQEDRSAKNYESAQAERGAGTAYNPEATSRSMAEQAGQATGAFQANLMGRELDTRRTEIERALSGAAGLLTAEQQMALQEELTKLNLAQQQLQFTQSQGQQESQFGRSLTQRGHEFTQSQQQQESQFARDLAQAESQFGRKLTQQESEFLRNLTQGAYEFGQNNRFRNSPLAGGG